MEDEKLAEARAAFDLDGKGNVILRPVLGWHCMPAAGMLVLLKLNYAQTPAEFRGEEKARDFQIALTPNQALELAATLQEKARHLLGQTAGRSADRN